MTVRARDLRGLAPNITGGLTAPEYVRRLRDDPDRPTGYATENVVQPSAAEDAAMRSWLEAILWATRDETWTR